MSLDDGIRERVILLGGKVAGVDCPHCEFTSRDIDLAPFATTDVDCPECGATILTESEKQQLQSAHKL